MFYKILSKLTEFGKMIAYDYMDMKKRWVQLILWPAYIVFITLYVSVVLLLLLVYTIWNVFNIGLTFGEVLKVFKEGYYDGLEELKEYFKGEEL